MNNNMVEKVKQCLRNCDYRKANCDKCSYRYEGLCSDNITDCTGDLAFDALYVIEHMEQKIKDKDDLIRSMSDEITELKEHIVVCFGECAYLGECDPVKFALCEAWKGGENDG